MERGKGGETGVSAVAEEGSDKDPCRCVPARQGQARAAGSGALGHGLGSPPPLPGVSPVRIPHPQPALPHHCSAAWGGTSQIRRNNGLGRGQVRLGVQQRAGAGGHPQRDTGASAQGGSATLRLSFLGFEDPAEASAPIPAAFPRREGILISPSKDGFSAAPGESYGARLHSPQGARIRDARRPDAPNFPFLGTQGSLESWPARAPRGGRLDLRPWAPSRSCANPAPFPGPLPLPSLLRSPNYAP